MTYKMVDLLRGMIVKESSDLFITVGATPCYKVNGEIFPIVGDVLTSNMTRELCYSIMNEDQRSSFESENECNFAIHPKKIGRFRINVFVQRNSVGMVVRSISSNIPSIEALRLPEILRSMIMRKRGLMIFVGGTGTGKSTSMAALVDHRNRSTRDHIVTIEDPIEFLHSHKKSIVTQREVGVDTESFDVALVNAMRQAPNVIQIGEIRTRETMDSAIRFSETGHLCIATLHANNSYQALDRIYNFFAAERREQLSMDLSLNLYGIVSQRLIARQDTKGLVPAVEILINTPSVAGLIKEHAIDQIPEVIKRSGKHGMQSFDQSLFELYEEGLISYKDALSYAQSENDLRLDIKLNSKRADGVEIGSSLEGVGLDDID